MANKATKVCYIVMSGKTPIMVSLDKTKAEQFLNVSRKVTYLPKQVKIVTCDFT
jgi:hypothetical protein